MTICAHKQATTARLSRRDFSNQLSIRIELISFYTQLITLWRMIGEIGDDKIDHEKRFAMCGHFKCKLDRSDRVLNGRAPASFFEHRGDAFDLDIKCVEYACRHLAAKNTRAICPCKLS